MNLQNETQVNKPDNSSEEEFDKLNRNANKELDKIKGFINVTTIEPSHYPKSFIESIMIWNNSGTFNLCIYDFKGHNWYYVELTSL